MQPRYAAMHMSKSWEWRTPHKLYEALDAEFHFNFDPCPLGGSEDGRSTLFTKWAGRRLFCNPPYGPEINKFLARALEPEVAVFLLPVRTDVRWFHEIVLPHAREIRFIKGRLKFGDATASAPFASDAKGLSREALQAVYDAIPGAKAVKRLRNRGYAIDRIWDAAPTATDAPEPRKAPRLAKETKVPGDSKKALVLRMLDGTGTTVDNIVVATGWARHTIRGMISTLRSKNGLNVVAAKDGKTTTYRIAS